MHANETILTPLFRYMLWCIEKDKSENYVQSCSEIKDFYREKQEERTDVAFSGIFSGEEKQALIDQTIHILELASQGKAQIRSYWEEICVALEKESCDRCMACKQCRSYFWQEIGELLLNETNRKKGAGDYLPMHRIPEQIEKHLVPSKKAADVYYENNCRNKTDKMDGCIILKGMSSSTPSLMNSIYDTHQFSGGGFFLRYGGIGVAIDPGYHFLDNLHHYGLSVLDINAVVVTHEHIDHNNDMRLLDDLHFAIHKYEQDEKKRKIHWYLDKVSYDVAKTYQKNETGFHDSANVLHCILGKADGGSDILEMSKEITIGGNDNFRLKFFPTKHIEAKRAEGEKRFKKHTFGCQFVFGEGDEKRCLTYTSDTKYFPELVHYMDMPDILIANISGVYEDDLMLVKPKERHLGYYGCYHLLNDIWKRFARLPDLVMLSEFWNGESDIRYDVSAFLERQVKHKCGAEKLRVVPADVGMVFQMADGSLRCSQCGKFTKKFLIRKPNGYKDKIRVYCDSCIY